MSNRNDIIMPGACWADLAEMDNEMKLMGPPTLIPADLVEVCDEWITPKRTTRRAALTYTADFLNMHNAFTMLAEQYAPTTQPEESQEAEAVRACWTASSPELDAAHSATPISSSSTFPAAQPPPLTRAVPQDSTFPASAS